MPAITEKVKLLNWGKLFQTDGGEGGGDKRSFCLARVRSGSPLRSFLWIIYCCTFLDEVTLLREMTS